MKKLISLKQPTLNWRFRISIWRLNFLLHTIPILVLKITVNIETSDRCFRLIYFHETIVIYFITLIQNNHSNYHGKLISSLFLPYASMHYKWIFLIPNGVVWFGSSFEIPFLRSAGQTDFKALRHILLFIHININHIFQRKSQKRISQT